MSPIKVYYTRKNPASQAVYKYFMTPDHDSSLYANQTILWFQTDSEERYQKNLAEREPELRKFFWVNRPFTYQFNSAGFRSDEFDATAPGILFLGCSHTVGVGLPAETTFSNIIAKELNLKCYNLGVAGAANDTAFRLADYYIPRLNIKTVVFLSSERTRLELFTADQERLILMPSDSDVKENIRGFYRYWLSNDVNSNMQHRKNVLAIQQLCSQHGIKFYHREFLNFPLIDKARDLAHYGINSNRQIAEKILATF
jgi:hypothetical protein